MKRLRNISEKIIVSIPHSFMASSPTKMISHKYCIGTMDLWHTLWIIDLYRLHRIILSPQNYCTKIDYLVKDISPADGFTIIPHILSFRYILVCWQQGQVQRCHSSCNKAISFGYEWFISWSILFLLKSIIIKDNRRLDYWLITMVFCSFF